ncbi:unnamed protein product [Rhizopus stolonifer]
MTVKSPFYNKPSTSTSVDSCHKCPLILPASMTADYLSAKKDQSVGFDPSMVSVSFSNNHIEPSNSSVAASDIERITVPSCSNCGTSSTPLWRRSPAGDTICNACGLYCKTRNTSRPVWTKSQEKIPIAPLAKLPIPPLASVKTAEKTVCIMACTNCKTTKTPLWRRDQAGKMICNACGLYYKIHHVHRPVGMKNSTIKRRNRTHPSKVGVHKMIYEPLMTQRRDNLRPLLPSPEPIEIHHYSPSRSTKNTIACLLNPEMNPRPHLPSPPHGDMTPSPVNIDQDVSLNHLMNLNNPVLLSIDQFIAKK